MPETAVVAERNLELGSSTTTAGPGLVRAHTGIRGLLAFYIMLFHALAFSAGWNLHGSALIPVFFLLAGYSLAIVYGKQRPGFDVKHYYRNRFARIAPVYYVAMLIALPLAVGGRGWVSPSDMGWVFATNLFAVQMWAGLPPLSFVGPSWTISTLAFFYLVFPWLLRWHQDQTDRSLNRWITMLAVVQAVVFFALSFAIGSVDSWWAFWASHAWPISRLPVFDMGLVAGLLMFRQGRPYRDTAVRVMGVSTDQKNRWAQRVDWSAGTFVVFVIGLSALQVVGDIDLLGSWWMQGIFPYAILVIICRVVSDQPGGKSIHATPAELASLSLPRQKFFGFVSGPRTHHSICRLGRPTRSGLEFQHAHAIMGDRHRAARKPRPRNAARTDH